MSWTSEGDRDCLYLWEIPGHGSGGAFQRLVKELGVEVPEAPTLREIVEMGWLAPRHRVQLPESFVRFLHGEIGEDLIPSDDHWAFHLWNRCRSFFPESFLARNSSLGGAWYRPPFEREGDELAAAVKAHLIPEEARQPALPLVRLESGEVVPAWMDFFAFWQAYELVEILGSSRLFAPVRNVPNARADLEGVLARFDWFKEFSDSRIKAVSATWVRRAPVFEWVGRYRTLLGIWLGRKGSRDEMTAGAKALASDLGLSADAMRAGIRDTLLVLWNDIDWRNGWEDLADAALERLRQDIYWAVQFLGQVAGDAIDLDDAFWNPPDRMAREWAALPDVLAFEWHEAKENFPRNALHYLEAFNLAAPGRAFDEAALAKEAERMNASVPFRRFILAFHRLHQHYGEAINSEFRIQLREETPIDFLALSALFAEKLVNEAHLSKKPGVPLPGFNGLVLWFAGEVERAKGLAGIRARVEQRMGETKLFDLPQTRLNPFKAAPAATEEALLEEAFVNFVKLRNYAAHHDALDFELIHTAAAQPVLQSLLLIVLMLRLPCCSVGRSLQLVERKSKSSRSLWT